MTILAILLIGFSLFSALALSITHFNAANYPNAPASRLMGLLLLAALSTLQIANFAWLQSDLNWVDSYVYRIALFVVAPTFLLFSRPLLVSDATPLTARQLWHVVPIIGAAFVPTRYAMPAAFLLGAAYLVWLGRSLLALRAERNNFRREIGMLGLVFLIAIIVAVLGLTPELLPGKLFYACYGMAIGLALFLVQLVLGLRPRLSTDIEETVQAAYAQSTLSNVDCDEVLQRLDKLMLERREFQNASLTLPLLAQSLAISSHQLSELLNSKLGKSFSRYLREQRVSAAKKMLLDEPSASVLSIGLHVGFTSQSNFYEAFRDIEGMTPGQFRKLHGKANSPTPPKI